MYKALLEEVIRNWNYACITASDTEHVLELKEWTVLQKEVGEVVYIAIYNPKKQRIYRTHLILRLNTTVEEAYKYMLSNILLNGLDRELVRWEKGAYKVIDDEHVEIIPELL